jgi:hypothetical protein
VSAPQHPKARGRTNHIPAKGGFTAGTGLALNRLGKRMGKVTSDNCTIVASVIPWESPESWGVAIVIENGRSITYEVGAKAIAEVECRRVEEGKPPLWGTVGRARLNEVTST